MLYVLAFFLPFISILLCGKPIQAVLNFVMFLVGFLFPPIWIVCIIHGFVVVSNKNSDKRTKQIVKAIEKSN